MTAMILLAVAILAFANGANDNFKGVATLFGSGTTGYRGAIVWATVTTLLGSLTAVLFAGKLIEAFRGKDLVDATLVADPTFVGAVALGAAMSVLIATRIGMPVSTTHAMIGALIGTAWAAGSTINTTVLNTKLLQPLLLSPVLAVGAVVLVYPLLRAARRRLGVTEETCICVGNQVMETVPAGCSELAVTKRMDHWSVSSGTTATCTRRYAGRVLGIEASAALDKLHFLSSGILSFARGLNDTPKIAALMLIVPALGGFSACAAVGCLIAVGGLTSAHRVAETLSRRIAQMNHGQGFTANVLAGTIIIAASCFGMPVSTTHVSCSALFGIGALTGTAHWRVIGAILAAWFTNLPLGGLLGYSIFIVLQSW